MPLTFPDIARRWPERLPFLGFSWGSRYQVIAVEFSEVSFEEFLQFTLPSNPEKAQKALSPFESGYVGVLSYEDLKVITKGESFSQKKSSSRIFYVTKALIYDELDRVWRLTKTQNDGLISQYKLDREEIEALLKKPDRFALPDLSGIPLIPKTSSQAYQSMVTKALSDIRAGRFYQINLLRYFDLAAVPSKSWILSRMMRLSEPFTCYLSLPDLTLASFSPERFLRLTPLSERTLLAQTEPIKGTAARFLDDPQKDREQAFQLKESAKDCAELHMIVDLLRNDLNRIAKRSSVKVIEPTRLVSYQQVHHLSALIEGIIPSGIRIKDFLAALCPSGSITGAPKLEVMEAIFEAEGRERGFFMGNAFCLDESGSFDSSVLIRTLVQENGIFEYAAGSGITVNSQPLTEEHEIIAKSKVIEADL